MANYKVIMSNSKEHLLVHSLLLEMFICRGYYAKTYCFS